MALSKEEREARIKLNEMLDRFEKDGKELFDSNLDSISINEAAEEKISNIVGLQNLLNSNKDRLIYIGIEDFEGYAKGNVNISLFLMSTKTVSVPSNDNLISFGFMLDSNYSGDSYVTISSGNYKGTTIEKFIGLPIVSDKEDAVTAKDLVSKCDANSFYKLYLDDALALIRKHFPCSYNMFVGPNLTKHLEPVIISREGVPVDNTLYVAYDAFRKKFKFSYNPKFILESTVNEWMMNRSRYNSLKDCYCYLLAFMITHEMLHIIHHNTVSDTFVDDSRLSVADGNVANTVMDSFINCKLAKGYKGASAIRQNRGLAPMLSDGVSSKVSVRIEHNKGLKKFESTKELVDKVCDVFLKDIGMRDIPKHYNNSEFNEGYERKISDYEGADLFITVDVSPQFNDLRKSTNLFQNFINDTIQAITDGKAHDLYSKVSDAEKKSDLDVLPPGTLVMIKGLRDIGVVVSHNEETDKYEINKADMTGVTHPANDEHLNIPVYTDSGNKLGIYDRLSIRPYNPENDAYRDDNTQEIKTEISQEDLYAVKQKMDGGMQGGGMPMPPQGGQKEAKSLKVGDIVWVRKAKRFGRIVSISNGKFEIEEMKELPCKVIDKKTVY